MLPRKRKNWKAEAKNPTPNFILDLSGFYINKALIIWGLVDEEPHYFGLHAKNPFVHNKKLLSPSSSSTLVVRNKC